MFGLSTKLVTSVSKVWSTKTLKDFILHIDEILSLINFSRSL